MTASCSCLKLCSLAVAFANISLGLYIFIDGVFVIQDFVQFVGVPIGLIIVYYQIASFLLFSGFLLFIGVIKEKEKYVSLYLLISSLTWFIISMLAISYMVFYNTMVQIELELPSNETTTTTTTTTTAAPLSTSSPPPKQPVPYEKAVGFSVGLVLIWCGQLCVYKFHDQVIEKNVIDAGESYVSSAIHSN